MSGVKVLTRGLKSTFSQLDQVIRVRGAMTQCVCALINMNGVRWHIKMWNWVVKHIRVGLQDVPSTLRNPVETLATVNGSKVEWSKDISVQVSEVQNLW